MQSFNNDKPKPSRRKFTTICLSLTDRQKTQLAAIAKFHGVGISEAFRRIFDGFVKNTRRQTRRELAQLDRELSQGEK